MGMLTRFHDWDDDKAEQRPGSTADECLAQSSKLSGIMAMAVEQNATLKRQIKLLSTSLTEAADALAPLEGYARRVAYWRAQVEVVKRAVC